MNDAAAVRRRAGLLWLGVTAGCAGALSVLAPSARALLQAPAAGTFEDLVVRGCALAALVAAGLLWISTTDVVARQLLRPGRGGHRVGPVRSLLLAACGVAVLTGTATPAHAGAPVAGTGHDDASRSVAGLPLPDRATGSPEGRRTVHVHPGDSLWSISARALGPDASPAEVASYWRRLQTLNAAEIGPDPDLLRPGQTLQLPSA